MTCRMSTTRSRSHLAAALLLTAALGGCGSRDDGPATAEQRGVDAFHSVELRGTATVELVVGPPGSLTLTAGPATLRETTTTVRNGLLVIEHESKWFRFSDHDNLKLRITTPALNSFSLSGAGEVDIDAGKGDALAVVLSGAGEIRVRGERQSLNARINGAGSIDLSKLSAVDASLYVNGAGNLTTLVTGSLQAEVNGVGNIRYAGNPQKVEPTINGVGSIKPVSAGP
jgi:hypothetical protein